MRPIMVVFGSNNFLSVVAFVVFGCITGFASERGPRRQPENRIAIWADIHGNRGYAQTQRSTQRRTQVAPLMSAMTRNMVATVAGVSPKPANVTFRRGGKHFRAFPAFGFLRARLTGVPG
jgi:hypothetical protein